ncbi:hypothetical protein Tco_1422172 [Tanacetum coccineum]
MKAYRANQIAKSKVVKDYTEQYSQLRDYVLELQRTNPSTTVKIEVERNTDQEDNSVAVDCNNGTYLVAYVVVEVETKDS